MVSLCPFGSARRSKGRRRFIRPGSNVSGKILPAWVVENSTGKIMNFSDLLYLFPVCLVALVFMALFWLITGYLAFYSIDRQLRRCPSCKRSAVGTIIDTQLEPLQVRIDHSKLTPVRYKREKVTDTYHC